ncbi:S15 family X-Pro dipeptidyl-peptidase [Nostoc piscinale CENA21]|uniref:S15 family X-Pro dipeptidyl-peptidase n=1 Tax=Nostoc piscinale CENA21 TaxID=224013 RepID=A0A0M4TUK0_9NOSO|nr:CocE/NonD family hydrolase [Nostoc piscinale]ALF53319.1 S15 family X-Pro dipeptidyl-peptidase [Nostoc piscinale CENA21]
MYRVLPKQTASMYTRDGVRLDADIYRPDAAESFPVLLMRQPYGRAIASTVVYAHPSWYAAQGYIVVIQDVRGRGTSAGEFKLFAHEIADGEDSIYWAAHLPGSNGKVGMYGFSYQGMTQLYAAVAKPSALKTICPAMIGYDLYTDWAYEGGAFCLQTNLAWAIQLATETARLRHDHTAYQALLTAARNLPLNNPEILQQLAPESFYHEWVAHPQADNYWEELSPKRHLQAVDLPIFHIGGWFDTYLRGTLRFYQDMAARSTQPQHLLVGPWAHLPWGRKVGEVDFGAKAASPVDRMQIRWFDQFLKDIDTGLLRESSICLFEMGSNIWHTFPNLNTANQKSYFLSTTGLASIREDSGILIQNPQSQIQNSVDVLVHDPWRPVPSLGGHAGLSAGVFERSHLDCRSDVLTYTSTLLTEDLHILGEVVVEIDCYADQPSYDVCAVLSQVQPDGKVYNLTQGYIHCPQNTAVPIKIQLQTTCVRIAKGNALRLSLSAACFPAYAMNSGNGAVLNSNDLRNAQVITLTVHCGGDRNSQIFLPVI